MKHLNFFLIFILFVAVTGCNNEELEQKKIELTLLQDQQKKDSLLLVKFTNEMNGINSLLDSISSVDEFMRESKDIPKADALQKLAIIDSLLQDKNMRITSLSTELKSVKSKFSRMLALGKVDESKSKIEIKSKYYSQLNKQIASLEQDNIDLKEIIANKDKEIIERDSVINILNTEREKQKQKLEDLQAEIIASAKELTDATNTTSQRYFDLAVDLRNIADKTNVIFNKKKKRNLLKMSLEYFERSKELGHADAEQEITKLKTNKKYKKLLK